MTQKAQRKDPVFSEIILFKRDVTKRDEDRVPFNVGSQWEQSIFPAEVFGAGAVDVTATATGEGGVEGLQIPFADPDLEHLFHRLFTAFKVFTEFFKGYSVLLFEELTQFEEDHGCVFRLRGNDSETGSGDITFLQ